MGISAGTRGASTVIALWVGSIWLAASSGCWPADHLDVLDDALHAEQCACRSC